MIPKPSPQQHPLKEKAQELLLERAKGAADPAAAAAQVADELIGEEIKTQTMGPVPVRKDEIVKAACHGVMGGLLLLDADLAKGAVALLGGMADVAQKNGIDPEKILTWCLEGIARIASAAPAGKVAPIGAALENAFMGTGSLFSQFTYEASQ